MTEFLANLSANFNPMSPVSHALPELDHLFFEQFAYAPRQLKDRLYASVTPTIAGDTLVNLARVTFERTLFDFDHAGRWAVVVPVVSNRIVADWAAFDMDNDRYRGTLQPQSFAVGIDEAEADAHHHPKSRLVVNFSVWTWLRNEAVGILPVCWPRTAAYLIATGYAIEGHTTADALLAEDALQRAAAIPPMYSRERDGE